MTASFIQTADGQLISATGNLVKLHVGYTGMTPQGKPDQQAVFIGDHVVGHPSPGGDVNHLLLNLVARAACSNGVFGIEDGSIFRRFINEKESVQIMHYGTGENTDWGSADARTALS